MIIHVYVVAYNEEFLMPFFMRHYKQFSNQITVFDNESTDKTAEMAKAEGAVVVPFSTNDTFMDSANIKIKNEEYKKSRGIADWVIVVDTDEFVYHPNFVQLLEEYKTEGITLPKIRGYDMIGDDYPKNGGQIYNTINQGVCQGFYSKRAIFNPLININYEVGAHRCSPRGNVVESKNFDLKLLHYRLLCKDFFVKKMESRMERFSEENRKRGWGILRLSNGETYSQWASRYYEANKKNRLRIIK